MEVKFPVIMRHTMRKIEVNFTDYGKGTVVKSEDDDFTIGEYRTDWSFDNEDIGELYWEPVESKKSRILSHLNTLKYP